jgi:cell division protein FtsN
MEPERGGEGGIREVRLEGLALVVVGGVLLASICGAYYLGRWVERRANPAQLVGAPGQGPLSQVTRSETAADATEDVSFFDDLRGDRLEAEPEREARPAAESTEPAARRSSETAAEKTTPPASRAADAGGQGDYWVQVFAGRDRSSAETLVSKLKREGYVVRVFSEREGQGLLFKVRVGGYPSKDHAQRTATVLKESGYSAWVPPLE